jgi:hypothetical protein
MLLSAASAMKKLTTAVVLLAFFSIATITAARPFKASHDGTLTLGEPFLSLVYDAEGTATHMGTITETGSVQFGDPSPACAVGASFRFGAATMIRANGDSVTFDVEECALVSAESGDFTSIGNFTFTEGTGKFTGATGSGTFASEGLLQLEGGYDIHTDYDGAIDY